MNKRKWMTITVVDEIIDIKIANIIRGQSTDMQLL